MPDSIRLIGRLTTPGWIGLAQVIFLGIGASNMEFFKLNSSHKPADTIQDFASLVWTERYQTESDFQLVVNNDVRILTALPIGSLVSHTDTNCVMIVENHEISRTADKKLVINVSGRSLETFLENRVVTACLFGLYDVTTEDAIVQTITAAAEEAARQLISNAVVTGVAPTNEDIPNVATYLVIRDPDVSMTHVIKRGTVYARVMDLLGICNAGLKTVRPNGLQTTMDLVIYDGLDLLTSVIFYAQYEDLVDAKYFWSNKGYRNYAAVAAHFYSRQYRHRDIPAPLSGLDRRILYVEADDLEGIYSPPVANDVIVARAQSALDEHKRISLLQAKISDTAKPRFKIDYNIGDLVTVFGEFSTAQAMRVTEHILTIDTEGMRGYPSLSAV